MTMIITGGKFPVGEIVFTRGIDAKVPRNQAIKGLLRHMSGDWGELGEDDRKRNDDATERGGRLLSRYLAPDGTVFWIITEHDRSVTTILLANEH